MGFAVSNIPGNSVISFESKGERMCNIILKGKFKNMSTINVYAPTEDADDEEKDSFFELL